MIVDGWRDESMDPWRFNLLQIGLLLIVVIKQVKPSLCYHYSITIVITIVIKSGYYYSVLPSLDHRSPYSQRLSTQHVYQSTEFL